MRTSNRVECASCAKTALSPHAFACPPLSRRSRRSRGVTLVATSSRCRRGFVHEVAVSLSRCHSSSFLSLLSTRCTSRSVPPVVATTHPLEWTGDRQAHTNRVLPSVRKGWTCKGMWRQGSFRHPVPPLRRLLIPRIRASVWEEPGHDQVRVQNCRVRESENLWPRPTASSRSPAPSAGRAEAPALSPQASLGSPLNSNGDAAYARGQRRRHQKSNWQSKSRSPVLSDPGSQRPP